MSTINVSAMREYALGVAEFNRQTDRFDVDVSEQWYEKPMQLTVDAEQPLDDQLDDLIDYMRSRLGNNLQAYFVSNMGDETYRRPRRKGNVVLQGYGKVLDECSFETRDLRGEIDLPANAGKGRVFYFVFSNGEEEDDNLIWCVFYPLR